MQCTVEMLADNEDTEWLMKKSKPKGKKETPASKAAAELGRIGGPARAKKLSAKRRKEIAEMGADARWKRPKNK